MSKMGNNEPVGPSKLIWTYKRGADDVTPKVRLL